MKFVVLFACVSMSYFLNDKRMFILKINLILESTSAKTFQVKKKAMS